MSLQLKSWLLWSWLKMKSTWLLSLRHVPVADEILEDILIYVKIKADHLKHVRKVLSKLRESNLIGNRVVISASIIKAEGIKAESTLVMSVLDSQRGATT
jgi:hypothetical protein